MPVSSGLNLNSGLSGVRPRPSGGVGLARPVASTQGIIAPQQAPQQPPVQQRTVAPPSLPKSAPAQPAPQAAPGGEMNAFSKIGLLLSNVAAGMEGRPLPSDQLEQNRLKREELKMRQTMQNMEIAGTIATIAAKTPGGQVSKVVEGLFATLPDQSQTSVIQPLVEALTAKPQIDEDTYPIVAPYLAQLYDVGGLDAVQKTLDSDDRMQALRDRAVAESRESADMKMQQVIGLVQKGAQSGVMPPDVAQSLSGTMTADKVKELNRALPPKMRLSAVETAAIEEFGFNGFGVTILSKKIADKVAEADALRPGELSEFEQKERLKQRFNPVDGVQEPMNVKEFTFFQTLPDEKKQEYLQVKRADRVVDIGGSVVNVTPGLPGSAETVAEKTLAPADQPENAAAKTTAVDTAKMNVEKQEKFPKAQAALAALEQQNTVVLSAIDEALANTSSLSAGFGSVLSGVPTTQAKALKASLDTIKANIGFDKLQDMKNNSPTGGALGPVSNTENTLLQSTIRGLDQGLDPAALKANLEFIKQNIGELATQRRAAFDSDFAGFEVKSEPKAPSQKAVDEMSAEEVEAELERLKKQREQKNGK